MLKYIPLGDVLNAELYKTQNRQVLNVRLKPEYFPVLYRGDKYQPCVCGQARLEVALLNLRLCFPRFS